MNLGEFITYCTLKDIVVLHERLDEEWHADVCNKQKLVIENDNWMATITYTHFAGEYNVLYCALSKVTRHLDIIQKDTSYKDILTKFV